MAFPDNSITQAQTQSVVKSQPFKSSLSISVFCLKQRWGEKLYLLFKLPLQTGAWKHGSDNLKYEASRGKD